MTTSVGNLLSWDLTTASIEKQTEDLKKKTQIVYDAVGSLSKDEVTYDNVVKVR